MYHRFLFTFFGLAFLFGLAACDRSNPGTVTLGSQDDARTIALKIGDTLVITLPGNPGTGYGWEPLPQDPTLLLPAGEPEFKAETDLLDAPGEVTMRFKAVTAGEAHFELVYKRPWEKEVDPLDTFEIELVVK